MTRDFNILAMTMSTGSPSWKTGPLSLTPGCSRYCHRTGTRGGGTWPRPVMPGQARATRRETILTVSPPPSGTPTRWTTTALTPRQARSRR